MWFRWVSVTLAIPTLIGFGCENSTPSSVVSASNTSIADGSDQRATSPVSAKGVVSSDPPAVVAEGQVEHPLYRSWAAHPVGTELVFKSKQTFKKRTKELEIRHKLVELTPDKAVVSRLEFDPEVNTRPQSMDDTIRRNFPLLPGVNPEDVGKPRDAIAQGEEVVTIGDQEFKTVWFDTKGRTEGGHESITRTWMCDDVPGRLVRARITVAALQFEDDQVLVEIKRPQVDGK